LLISNHNSYRVLLDKIASVYFIWEAYLYFSVGNGQPRGPALCQLYRHIFVPYSRGLSENVRTDRDIVGEVDSGWAKVGPSPPPRGEEWATLIGASLRCGLSLKFFDHLLYFTKSNKADFAPLWVVTLSARKVVPCVRWPATGWHYCTQFIAKPKAACALRFS